jgi:hypothetical protein
MAKETYERDSYAAYLGRRIDPEEIRKAQEDEARKAALKLSDLEAYYRQWVEDHLYNRQNVYTDPTLTQDDLARLTQMDSDDFNRFFNAYLLILQEQGIDVNDPDSFMDAQQRKLNGIDRQLAELENASRDGDWQTKYDELIRQRQAAEDLYNKAQGIWQYVDDARAKGWTPDAVGDSGADFSAIDGSRAGRQYREERMAEGFGSGGDLSGLWLPEQKEKKPRAYNGGIINGVYVPAGTYTEEEWQAAITSPYNRVGEDGLTGGQRMEQMREQAEASRRAATLASLIDVNRSTPARNNTAGWLSDEYPDINTNVANANTSGITLTDAGRAYLAELAAKNDATADTTSDSGTDVLAALLDSGGGYSDRGSSNLGPTGLTPEETGEMQKSTYLGMLDAMARGRANTGGYTNTAALQAANAIYDAYKDVLPDGNRMAAYLRYQGDSGNRAGQKQYSWLNRAKTGGTRAQPKTTQTVTTPTTQGSIGTIPTISGGTPVSGTPVGMLQRPTQSTVTGSSVARPGAALQGASIPNYNVAGQLMTPQVMRAQDDYTRLLSALFGR